MLKKDRFTKTGSGHTQEKLTKKIAFRSNQARAAAGAPDSHRNGFAREGARTVFFSHFYFKMPILPTQGKLKTDRFLAGRPRVS